MISEFKSITARIREFISRNSIGIDTGVSSDEFNSLALELYALQFALNAPYHRICESRGIKPTSVQHWTQIPAVPAAAFKEFELTCLTPAERTSVFYSSGTTEQRRSQHFHCAESLTLYEASLSPWFQANVLVAVGQAYQPAGSPGLPARCSEQAANHWQLAILTPPAIAAPNSSLVHMFQTICREHDIEDTAFLGYVEPDGSWALDFKRTESAIQTSIAAQRPLVLLGTAFNFVHLLDELEAKTPSFKLTPGSIAMETGGYKGRSRELPKTELHALITRTLGVPRSHIICEYGMSELSSQAYDSADFRNTQHATRNYHFPPWARVQIISPETGREVSDGEIGLVRIYDLANAFSVLAVQTEDLAIRHGDGFELVGRATAAEARGCSLMTA